MINKMINKILKQNLDDLAKRIKENDSFFITIEGKPSQGMSSKSIMINQVFDEELAKLTDKNISKICKKSK
jgi:hypothetical protein